MSAPAAVQAPPELSDVLDGSRLASGATVRLGPWDVRVFVGESENGASADDPGNTGLRLTVAPLAPRPGTVPSRAG
ncbi:hypothetical protein ACIRP3_24035 [Streptomyces sp. NPDC101209]|uniref:hypothetical protein n=1 Tax=Streptomyces sp. NPDC101209 TaxID=3366129 RepID=UPI00380AD993